MILRFKIILFIILLSFSAVILRLFYWQVIRANELSLMGQQQYGRVLSVEPKRGEIKTSDGYPIAGNKIAYLIYANPKEIEDRAEASEKLSEVLSLDIASVSANLKMDLFWVPIARQVDPEKKKEVEKMEIPGVGWQQEYVRYYPEGSMAAHLIGFVGKDEQGKNKGYFGAEGYYDRLLAGKEGKAIQIHDALGRPILTKMNQVSSEVDGDNLILSINRTIQYIVEKNLKNGIEKYQAESGMVGVMDPRTGEILAMASFPNFDPGSYTNFPDSYYKNPFISNTFEPGSTFKPLVMSAALDAKLVKPQTKCTICAGPVSIGGYDIHTWNDKYTKNISMTDVIIHSDNTGMVFVAQRLGVDKMIEYLDKYGIGSLTGIDLQGETTPSLKSAELWYPVDLATTGFGQGISVTPIELLSAISAIANKGKRMEPHVVSAVEDSQGKITKIKPKELDSPISQETAKVMTEIMVNAVSKGEAQWAALDEYRIAGKTGTASIPIQGHYDPNQTIASFVGFAPADDPKFVMYVILDRPKSSIYGAETAAPVFFNIAKDILLYYKVSPS